MVESRPGGNGTIGADGGGVSDGRRMATRCMFNASYLIHLHAAAENRRHTIREGLRANRAGGQQALAVATAKELPVTDVKSR